MIPLEALLLFSPRDVTRLIAGAARADVDIDALAGAAQYEPTMLRDENATNWLWSVLREGSATDRIAFLRFVTARSRLPGLGSVPVIRITRGQTGVHADKHMPTAKTCFATLELPLYSSCQVLAQRLRFAIHNTPSMDADVIVHGAEGWE